MKRNKHRWQSIVLFALGSLIGALLGFWGLRSVVSAMAAQSPVFWFVSRAAGLVAYVLLWACTVWGILISSRAVKDRVSGPMAYTLHNVTAWLALGFAAVHAWALLGDQVVTFSPAGILLPFMSTYQPLWTGLGTLSLYAGLLVSLSFYIAKRIGHRTWHLIHMLSYLMFLAVTVHSLLLGTDSITPVMQVVYFLAGGSVLFLTLVRILVGAGGSPEPNRAQDRRQGHTGSPG
jgi:sulfoxide reductase heme-binding subunit YedZ